MHDPDFFRRKYHTGLILSYATETEICIEMLDDIRKEKMIPEYIMKESTQIAGSLYAT